jgi:hypothetical protein
MGKPEWPLTCPLCDCEYTDGYIANLDKGQVICPDCHASELGDASSVVAFGLPPGEPPTYHQVACVPFIIRFSELVAELDPHPAYEGEPAEFLPDWWDELGITRRWKRIDGWRGYWQTSLSKHYVGIASGWLTGHPDSTTSHKMEAAVFHTVLKEGKLIPPKPIYWTFDRSSNVFSTISDIWVHEDHKEEVLAWLEEQGLGDIQQAFD